MTAESKANEASPFIRTLTRGIQLVLGVSLVLVALHIANLYWWIHAFNQGHSQIERVSIYLASLPGILPHDGTSRLTWLLVRYGVIGMACGAPAVVLGLTRGKWAIAVLGFAVVAANGLFTLWYLFTLM